MDLVTIGLRANGERFINYNRKNNNIPDDTEIMTLKELPDEVLERIKQETFEKVQIILNDYL